MTLQFPGVLDPIIWSNPTISKWWFCRVLDSWGRCHSPPNSLQTVQGDPTSECFSLNLMKQPGAKETQIPVVDLLASALQSFACGAFLALLLRLLAVLRRRSQRMTRQWQLREMQLLAELGKGRNVSESLMLGHGAGFLAGFHDVSTRMWIFSSEFTQAILGGPRMILMVC